MAHAYASHHAKQKIENLSFSVELFLLYNSKPY